jgi:hypothetical protein
MSQSASAGKNQQEKTATGVEPESGTKTSRPRFVLPARPREQADVAKGAKNNPSMKVVDGGPGQGLMAVSEIDAKVEKAYEAAGMAAPDSAKMDKGGLSAAPKTQAEAKYAIQDSLENAILYYSTPSRMQELGDTLRYLLPRYGVKVGGLDEETVQLGNRKFQSTLSDPAEHAVFTDLMVRVYDGVVERMERAGKKSGQKGILKIGEGGEEVTKIGKIPALEKAYLNAVRRDHSTVWELSQDKDGKTVLNKRKAAGFFDWIGHTGKGIKESGDTDEAIGYAIGSTLRAIIRLSPALLLQGTKREIEKKGDVRHETAKLLTQIESLCKREVGIARPQRAEGEKADSNAVTRGEGASQSQNTSYTYSQAAGIGEDRSGAKSSEPKPSRGEGTGVRRGAEQTEHGEERGSRSSKTGGRTDQGEDGVKVGKLPKGGGSKRGKRGKTDREI